MNRHTHNVVDGVLACNILRSYTYGPGIDPKRSADNFRMEIGQGPVHILSMTVYGRDGSPQPSATIYFYLKDHQNSVIALVDEAGAVVESYDYDAYGNVTILDGNQQPINSSTIGNRYLFQGREYDSDTGLYYFRARWYNPETGRWLSKDPVGVAGGLNLYAFCSNNSVNYVDPLGLCEGDPEVTKVLDELAKTEWGQTKEGKEVIDALRKANAENKAVILFSVINDEGKRVGGLYSPKEGTVMISRGSKDAIGVAGAMAHEGVHMVDDQNGTLHQDGYDFGDERSAYDADEAVKDELEPGVDHHFSDDDIRDQYGF